MIAESGSALDNWAVDLEPSYASDYLTSFLGCDIKDQQTGENDNDAIFQCMLQQSEEDLVRAENALIVRNIVYVTQ